MRLMWTDELEERYSVNFLKMENGSFCSNKDMITGICIGVTSRIRRYFIASSVHQEFYMLDF
jgi:hypothetical protein